LTFFWEDESDEKEKNWPKLFLNSIKIRIKNSTKWKLNKCRDYDISKMEKSWKSKRGKMSGNKGTNSWTEVCG
jgi:hypothetical protein